ncbi:MAG: hypothetical protein QM589_11715 [Thermomicrobiales bacterium]
MTTHNRLHRRWYDTLAYCCGFWGISAVLGGTALVAGMLPIPTSLLDGSPFPSYTIPGIALIAVGVGSLLCGIALPKRRQRTVHAAGAVGAGQVVFLGVEFVVVGFSWLLAIYAAVAIATIALAWYIAAHTANPETDACGRIPQQHAS